MRFRSKHIADSVTERIAAIADSVRNNKPLPAARGAAVISLARQGNGDLVVTKSFEHGDPEIMTISGNAPTPQLPAGFVDVTPDAPGRADIPPIEQQLQAGIDTGGIAANAATGGNAIDQLLRT